METSNYLKSGKRLDYLDVAKGIAILTVILGHVGIIGDIGPKGLFYMRKIDILFYIFHMPIFFIISGYLFKPYDFKVFISKKIKGFVIPYYSCALIITLFNVLRGLVVNPQNVVKVLKNDLVGFLLQRRYTTLWFLTALFFGLLIFWCTVKLCHDSKKTIVILLLFSVAFISYDELVSVPLPYNIDTAFIIQVYLAFGYFTRKYGWIEKLINDSKHKWIRIVAYSGLALLLTGINYKVTGGHSYEMFGSSYGIFPLTISAAILASVAVILFSSSIHSKVLQYLGKNSMIYFAFHARIGVIVGNDLVRKIGSLNSSILRILIIFVVAISICWLMDVVIRHSKLRFVAGR